MHRHYIIHNHMQSRDPDPGRKWGLVTIAYWSWKSAYILRCQSDSSNVVMSQRHFISPMKISMNAINIQCYRSKLSTAIRGYKIESNI